MPTLYLTEDYSLVRRDSEDTLLVQIPEKRAKDGATPAPARKEHIPLVKIDEVVVLGEVTLTASALHLLLERHIEITFLSHFVTIQKGDQKTGRTGWPESVCWSADKSGMACLRKVET